MKQKEVKKELKLKAAKSGGKVTPVTGNDIFFLLNSLNTQCLFTHYFLNTALLLANQMLEEEIAEFDLSNQLKALILRQNSKSSNNFFLLNSLNTLPSLINVYTRLFFQPQFSTIHVLIRDYTFISFDKTKIEFYSEIFFSSFIYWEKGQTSFCIAF